MNGKPHYQAILAFLAIAMVLVAPLALPADATAQSTGWQAQYFGNMSLAGAPTLVRTDGAINFNWGTGSPDSRIPSDGFSVRWTRTAGFDAGRYRFSVESDDGIRLFVDGALVIDQWRDQAPTAYAAERSLGAGNHTVVVEFYENRGGALARAWWERIGSDVPITDWRGEYFNNRALAGMPALVRNDASINFNWGQGSPDPLIPADNFSVRWSRTSAFDAGRYRFSVTADDGVRLYADGILLIDQWHDQPPTTYSIDVILLAGNHAIRMEYYENGGGASASLQWQRVDAAPTPTPPPTASVVWRGEYFTNANLTGAPTVIRSDDAINFDWGTNAPDSRIPADGFSVRWSRSHYFFAGRYRFRVRTDDGARLYIDGTRILDAWRVQSATDYAVERDLPAGNHTIRLEYFDNAGQALIMLSWDQISGTPTSQWRGEYYNNPGLSGAPVFVRDDPEINFHWGNAAPDSRLPADNFSVRWIRQVRFSAGNYVFRTRSDDGVRLFIDGQLVINQWHEMTDAEWTVRVGLSEGVHTVMMEYYERFGNASAELSWSGPTQTPSAGNLITCLLPTNSWIKAYQLTPEGTWLDINPRGWGPIDPSGFLKIDALPVNWYVFGPTGNPYKIELWAEGRLIRSTGNTSAGEPEFRIRPDVDNYTPWACSSLW